MPRYAVFLRAINVGGRRVTMDLLRQTLEGAGCSNVETLIASGNVALESPMRSETRLVDHLEEALTARLGFDVSLFVRSAGEMAALTETVAGRPADGIGTLYVAFLSEPPSPATRKRLREASTATDSLEEHGREVLWTCRTSFLDSPLSGPALERLLATPTTVRKSTTVSRVAHKMGVTLRGSQRRTEGTA